MTFLQISVLTVNETKTISMTLMKIKVIFKGNNVLLWIGINTIFPFVVFLTDICINFSIRIFMINSIL